MGEFGLWTLILFTFNDSVWLQKTNPTLFNIGGVLSNADSEKNFADTISVSYCFFSNVPKHYLLYVLI